MKALIFTGILAFTLGASCKNVNEGDVKAVKAIDYLDPKGWAGAMGMILINVDGVGLQVRQTRDFGYAHVIGIQEGDYISKINGIPVNTPEGFEKTVSNIPKMDLVRWEFDILRGRDKMMKTTVKGYECSPLDLIGCGPDPTRKLAESSLKR
jgi:S1-C subfamily serine protease